MKKCSNCIHLSIFNECDYYVNYRIEEDKFIGNKKIRTGNFEPIFKMRAKKAPCGPQADLYSSKYKHFFMNMGILTVIVLTALYMLKLFVLFLDSF